VERQQRPRAIGDPLDQLPLVRDRFQVAPIRGPHVMPFRCSS
jgi:hypothetical protein